LHKQNFNPVKLITTDQQQGIVRHEIASCVEVANIMFSVNL